MPESREINKLDPGIRRGDDLFRVSLSMHREKQYFLFLLYFKQSGTWNSSSRP